MDVLAYLVSVRDSLATGVRGRFQAYHLADDDSILEGHRQQPGTI
jgi:hypothetical protein